FEQLEDRVVPAPTTFTWSGTGVDNKWATDGNWVGGVHPTGDPAKVEELVFPAVAAGASKTPDNNLPTNSVFNSITFGTGGYTLTGSPIVLGIPGVTSSASVSVAAGAAGNVFSIDA